MQSVEERYDYFDVLTRQLSGDDLHYGYWESEEDTTGIEDATDRMTRFVASRFDPAFPGTILDVGCGRGRAAVNLSAATGRDVLAVDVDRKALRTARDYADAYDVEGRVTVEHADALDPPHPEGSFGGALLLEVTVHFDIGELYRSLARVLRPGGRIVAENPYVRTAGPLGSQEALTDYLEMFGCTHINDLREYVEAAHGAGMEVREALDTSDRTSSFFPRILDRIDGNRDSLERAYGKETLREFEQRILSVSRVSGLGSLLFVCDKPYE
ncbi:methyltransferase family protein [Haloactinospora alba]|uniref:Methyltransferase family protein n=1 Tax=Haloactinospora alba TaxID=405555 RepID=A0A543NAD6_9ACTN|nr:class I SAM-dependent methyltransferase [Haloactinospora alba]TQN28814.1 methyltransferase family protein [Haloactinospora alba]